MSEEWEGWGGEGLPGSVLLSAFIKLVRKRGKKSATRRMRRDTRGRRDGRRGEGGREERSPDNLVNGEDCPWVSVRVTFFLRIRQVRVYTRASSPQGFRAFPFLSTLLSPVVTVTGRVTSRQKAVKRSKNNAAGGAASRAGIPNSSYRVIQSRGSIFAAGFLSVVNIDLAFCRAGDRGSHLQRVDNKRRGGTPRAAGRSFRWIGELLCAAEWIPS